MLLTLSLLVLGTAILVFFSDEFAGVVKKIANFPGVKLLVPLFLASWLVLKFEHWFALGFYWMNRALSAATDLLMKVMPIDFGARKLAQIILLTLISILPVLFLDWVNKKRSHRPFEYNYLLSSLIFMVCALVMLVI